VKQVRMIVDVLEGGREGGREKSVEREERRGEE
jgi:hypothetical protein